MRALAPILAALLLAGCASDRLLGTSDVPAVKQMIEVKATDVVLTDRQLLQGHVDLVGPCDDAKASLVEATERMRGAGWQPVDVDADRDRALRQGRPQLPTRDRPQRR